MAEKKKMHIGQCIKRLREEAKMQQKDLAKKVGVTVASLSGYENDISEPSLHTTMKLAEVLGVSIDYLVSGKKEPLQEIIEEKTGLTTNAVRVLMRFNQIDMDYADIVSEIIETTDFQDAITELGTAKQIIADIDHVPEELIPFIRHFNKVHKSHGGSNDSMQIKYLDIAEFHAYEAKDKMCKAVDSFIKEVMG